MNRFLECMCRCLGRAHPSVDLVDLEFRMTSGSYAKGGEATDEGNIRAPHVKRLFCSVISILTMTNLPDVAF